MSPGRGAVRGGQICLLLLVAAALLYWWRVRPPVIVSDDAIDDLIEEVGDTYVNVHVGQVERGTLRQMLTAYGTVEPASATPGHEAGYSRVGSPSIAMVAKMECSEGQKVEKSTPLFLLDARQSDAAIDQAQENVAADRVAVGRLGGLIAATLPAATQPATQPAAQPGTPLWRIVSAQRQLAADQAELDQLRKQSALLHVVSPIAGTITRLDITAGETADPRKMAVEIVDLDRLVVAVDVPAANLKQVHEGEPATVELQSEESTDSPATQPATKPVTVDATVHGQVVLIDPAINPATGMGSADISIPAGSGLRPGEFVRAQITTGEETDRLIVPVGSVTQNQNGDPAIGKVETDGRWAVLVPVKTGWRDGGQIAIEGAGLDAGQPIVTVGADGLVQRTRLHLLRD
jgi:membrane fusion protein (multidrug efflux system)